VLLGLGYPTSHGVVIVSKEQPNGGMMINDS
jgi:hypothetical protein